MQWPALLSCLAALVTSAFAGGSDSSAHSKHATNGGSAEVGSRLGPHVPPGLVGPGYDFVDGKVVKRPEKSVQLPGDAWVVKTVGKVLSAKRTGDSSFLLQCEGSTKVLVTFYRMDIVRVQLAWDGDFDDPAKEIVVGEPTPKDLRVEMQDLGQFFDFQAQGHEGAVRLRAEKEPLRLALFRGSSQTPVWAEQSGLSRNGTATFQTLAAAPDEAFFGGGMQNGYFSHRDHVINIAVSYNWDDGGSPNAAPFYISSAGYGVFRCTWAEGTYDFRSPNIIAHKEQRFDAFYFAGAPRDFKGLLEGYTYITGRPFMPPVYALGIGDSDCYHNNRHGNNTNVALSVMEEYRQWNMPLGWMLVNDGYGCGYGEGPKEFPSTMSTLSHVSKGLLGDGVVTGLWSGTDFSHVASEVSDGRVRVLKTDVAWVGGGGKFAFDAVEDCVAGIENNSDARRFIWTVEGWAGTHRNAVMWTGDNYGSFESIRWQVPTFAGCGFSAQAHVSADIDGIFGGSAETQVRDLQWKCFTTVLMSMSGWSTANPDKQPFSWGEPYASINRMYLSLKMRLTPYFYSISRIAYELGTPPIRAMVMEFPDDDFLLQPSVGSGQQFMAGPAFLVAPVYKALEETKVRDDIYLPAGDWVDFWSGAILSGPQHLYGYEVPLEKLPVFVRAGAIIPMWPAMRYAGELPVDTLTLDIYPDGKSSFELYEDDGVTRAHEKGDFAKTPIVCTAPGQAMKNGGVVNVTVGPTVGRYRDQLQKRTYMVKLHVAEAPSEVFLHTSSGVTKLKAMGSKSALGWEQRGWFYDRTMAYFANPYSYTFSSWQQAFSTTGQDCSTGDCPPWHHQVLIVKVPTEIGDKFELTINVRTAHSAKFASNAGEFLPQVHLSRLFLDDSAAAEPVAARAAAVATAHIHGAGGLVVPAAVEEQRGFHGLVQLWGLLGGVVLGLAAVSGRCRGDFRGEGADTVSRGLMVHEPEE